MIRVTMRMRPVYRAEAAQHGRGRLRKSTAYLDAAWIAWRTKYPCTCEHEVGFVCG